MAGEQDFFLKASESNEKDFKYLQNSRGNQTGREFFTK